MVRWLVSSKYKVSQMLNLLTRKLSLLLVLVSVMGCASQVDGPERYAIKGTVSLDGAPVARASLRFTPDASAGTSGPAAFVNAADGEFLLNAEAGLVAGQSMVEITVYSDDGRESQGTVTQSIQVDPSGPNEFDLKLSSKELRKSSANADGDGDDESEED